MRIVAALKVQSVDASSASSSDGELRAVSTSRRRSGPSYDIRHRVTTGENCAMNVRGRTRRAPLHHPPTQRYANSNANRCFRVSEAIRHVKCKPLDIQRFEDGMNCGRARNDSISARALRMPYRLLAASEMAEFLRALAHPRRIQILEELRGGERDVASLAKAVELAHSSVSQHLMVLRARIVAERREGRRVFYGLRSEALADWLVRGMDFLPPMDQQTDDLRKAIKKAKSKWSG